MNRSHLWKVMLSTIALCLAMGISSLAQRPAAAAVPGSCSATWSNACTGSPSKPYYSSTCTQPNCAVNLVVDSSNGNAIVYPSGGSPSNAFSTLCLSIQDGSSASVQWANKAVGAGFVLQFGDSDPFSNPTPAVLVSTANNGGSIASSAGNSDDGACFGYTIAYCPPMPLASPHRTPKSLCGAPVRRRMCVQQGKHVTNRASSALGGKKVLGET